MRRVGIGGSVGRVQWREKGFVFVEELLFAVGRVVELGPDGADFLGDAGVFVGADLAELGGVDFVAFNVAALDGIEKFEGVFGAAGQGGDGFGFGSAGGKLVVAGEEEVGGFGIVEGGEAADGVGGDVDFGEIGR